MKKSRIFMVAGTFALAITAMFATKANKKFRTFNTVKFGSLGLYVTGTGVSALNFTTKASNGHIIYATLYTTSGDGKLLSNGQLETTISGTALYLVP